MIQDSINRIAALASLRKIIREHGDARITKESIEAHSLESNSLIILARIGSQCIGATATILADDKTTCNTVVVVSREYRKQGIGTLLLGSLALLTQSRGYKLTAKVADDNIASNALCSKRLLLVDKCKAKRSSGEYIQLIYSS